MRVLPDGMAAALAGSTSDAQIQFNVWYEGDLVAEDLDVGAWGMNWDSTRQVRCQTKATVIDDDATLTPWDISDALGAGGGILQASVVVGGMSVPVGWQVISSAEPEETWRTMAGDTLWVPGGATIPIEAEDRTEGVMAYNFIAPERPLTGNTIVQEITRLLTGLLDVQVDDDVVDLPVPTTVTYKDDRMAAVEDLVAALGARWRMTGDGQFNIYTLKTASVWATVGGSEGNIISVKRSLKLATRYNGFVSRNTAPDGSELQGVATETTGASRWGGPLGYRPQFRAASFVGSQAGITADAQSALVAYRSKSKVILPVRTVLHPGIELDDFITVNLPLPDGTAVPVTGRVLTIDWSGTGNLPVGMDLTLECNDADVRRASTMVKAGRWLAM